MKIFLIAELSIMILSYIFFIDAVKRGIKRNEEKIIKKYGLDYKTRNDYDNFGTFLAFLRISIAFLIPILNLVIAFILIFNISLTNKYIDEVVNEITKGESL